VQTGVGQHGRCQVAGDEAVLLNAGRPRLDYESPVTRLGPVPGLLAADPATGRVELHHGDLGTGYGPADWSAGVARMELPEPVRTLGQDVVDRAQQAPGLHA
jgi:hypothetical protein